FLQTRIAAAVERLPDLSGKRIGVVTGRAMGPLMPQVLADVAATTGGRFELVVVENTLFGSSVTTAGLLPGAAIERALGDRRDLDFVLLPAEAVNDDLVFVDDVSAGELAERLPCPVHLSYDFADVLTECGIDVPASTPQADVMTRSRQSNSVFRTPHWGTWRGRDERRPHRCHHRPPQRGQIHVVQPAHRGSGCDRGPSPGRHARSTLRRGRVERTAILAGGHGRDGPRR